MHQIIVAPEPNESRPLYRWRVAGPRLLATGIALTQDEAWHQARLATEERTAAWSAGSAADRRALEGHVAYD